MIVRTLTADMDTPAPSRRWRCGRQSCNRRDYSQVVHTLPGSTHCWIGCRVDIGVGLNVRRLRSQFLSTFDTTYSLRPIGEVGTVFRRWPGLWKVFISDPNRPGRFKLAAERPSRPSGKQLRKIPH